MQLRIPGAVALAGETRRTGVTARRVRALPALSPGAPVPFDRLVEQLWAGEQKGNARNAPRANAVRLLDLSAIATGHADGEDHGDARGRLGSASGRAMRPVHQAILVHDQVLL